MSRSDLQAEMASLQHKGRGVVLPAPGGIGANDSVMQAGYEVPQVVATGGGQAAVEPLLGSKLIQVTDKLDGHLSTVACAPFVCEWSECVRSASMRLWTVQMT